MLRPHSLAWGHSRRASGKCIAGGRVCTTKTFHKSVHEGSSFWFCVCVVSVRISLFRSLCVAFVVLFLFVGVSDVVYLLLCVVVLCGLMFYVSPVVCFLCFFRVVRMPRVTLIRFLCVCVCFCSALFLFCGLRCVVVPTIFCVPVVLSLIHI